MLLTDYDFPTLLLSFDNVSEETAEIAAAVAKLTDSSGATLSDSTQNSISSSALAVGNSDLNSLAIQVPIIFSSAIFPASVKGMDSSMNKIVEYVGDTPVVYQGNNTLHVRIQVKNSLTEVSAVANVLLALADKVATQTTKTSNGVNYRLSTRASFFSSTFTIYNAYLTAINRSTVDGSDVEIIQLTFEKTTSSSSSSTDASADTSVTLDNATTSTVTP